MKKNEIIKCLKANKQISDYQLIINTKDSRELFYVLDHLEINRAVKTTTTVINVYVSDGKYTGSSTVTVTSADDQRSLDKKIKDAVRKTKEARNPYYPLPDRQEEIKEKKAGKADLNAIGTDVAKAVFAADRYKDGWLNSTEIFVSDVETQFLDSKGTRHEAHRFNIGVEVIPTWSKDGEEIELYKYYESSAIDYKAITREIDELLQNARERANAVTPKEIGLPEDLKVLVKNDMLQLILDSISFDFNYQNIYFKENHYDLKDQISDTKLSLTLKPVIKGCARSARFDEDGIVLKSTKVIKDGKVDRLWGSNRFAYYLGKKATGNLPLMELDGPRSEYRREKHLIIENFSSPQLEETSGYWGGEVRLARYFDGKKYIPLTGFSISGNIYEDLKTVELSKEDDLLANYKGPKYMIFKGIKIH
ncbi:MAG: hypothetical protein IKE38_02240 [Erysipelotrichaceae bacterium]|nr:hypothetical protein [Erysipelotrichaceae bacterium]